MFQGASILCERADGSDELVSVSHKSLTALLPIRKRIMETGECNGIPVRAGFVHASWNVYPEMHFTCQPMAATAPRKGRKSAAE